jgi:glycosyltransferase involved in cell wall biosynthesis
VKILLVHNGYRERGGEDAHVDAVAEALADAGCEVDRYLASSLSVATEGARLRTGLTMAYSPAAARSIRRKLETFRPDIVHAHNLVPLLTPSVLRTARSTGATVVATLHNHRFACPSGDLMRNGRVHDDCVAGSSLACALRGARGSYVEGLAYGVSLEMQRRLRLNTRWVDAFIAPSGYIAEVFRRAGNIRSRVEIIPHGVSRALRGTEARYALFAGRLSGEKGIDVLARAARLAPDVPIIVAGSGELAPLLAGIEGITLTGQLSREGVGALQADAAFVVVPSTCPEVFPLSAVEALAAGKPLVASAIGGLPEIVRDGVTGITVPPGDPDKLASAMGRLWREPELRANLAAGAVRTFESEYRIEDHVERLINLYRELRDAIPRS